MTSEGNQREFSNVKKTLAFTIALVAIVIFVFLRSLRATTIPGVTVPLALVGSFAILYLGGYRLDNLSLMALTLAVGLVVDVVMPENTSAISRRATTH